MENRNNFIKNSVKKNLEKKNQKRKKSFVKSLDFCVPGVTMAL